MSDSNAARIRSRQTQYPEGYWESEFGVPSGYNPTEGRSSWGLRTAATGVPEGYTGTAEAGRRNLQRQMADWRLAMTDWEAQQQSPEQAPAEVPPINPKANTIGLEWIDGAPFIVAYGSNGQVIEMKPVDPSYFPGGGQQQQQPSRGGEPDPAALAQQRQIDKWNADRELAGTMNDPKDFILKYLGLNKPQPIPIDARLDKLSMAREKLAAASNNLKLYGGSDPSNPYDSEYGGPPNQKMYDVALEDFKIAAMEYDTALTYLRAGRAGGPAGPSIDTPDISREKAIGMGMTGKEWRAMGGGTKAPPAEAWMQSLIPGQTEGYGLTKEQAITPSAQQWSRMPWEQRQKFEGYVNWANKIPFEQLMENMGAMVPGGTVSYRNQWTPAKQR